MNIYKPIVFIIIIILTLILTNRHMMARTVIQHFINAFAIWPSTLVSILHSLYSCTLSVSFYVLNCGQ